MPNRIALIGSGLIGCGWAVVFSRAGWDVALHDIKPGRAKQAVEDTKASLANLEACGFLESADACAQHLLPVGSLDEAIEGATFVQENVLETPEEKLAVFQELDRKVPGDIILGSSASTIPASKFTEHLDGRERCIIVHPCTPPYLVPLVEIVPAPWTAAATTQYCVDLMTDVNLVPILLHKEMYGFVLNRLQVALVNEAMHLVGQGVASPADVEKTLKNGLGLRWSFMGPFQTMDLAAPTGFKEYATKFGHSYRNMGKELGVAEEWSTDAIDQVDRFLRDEVPLDKLAERGQWRDRKLMKLASDTDN
ncbi:MAG: 3-hydroxyacyl-CoA dehydrogenase [Rhodospirillaceae bacterium]|nr:3-hydroxyacyl-CoA dehydrogenase [Rhodospirillaceae bacterium]